MKNLMLILSMLFMMSCGSDATKKDDAKADAEKEKTENVEQADDATKNECDKFLDDYEKWVVEIENTYKKVKADPTDTESLQKILKASEQLMEWANKWDGLVDCADDEKYEDRILELEDRINKLNEM